MDNFFNYLRNLRQEGDWPTIFWFISATFFKESLQFGLLAILWKKCDREMKRLHSSETGFANIGAPSLRNFPARIQTFPASNIADIGS